MSWSNKYQYFRYHGNSKVNLSSNNSGVNLSRLASWNSKLKLDLSKMVWAFLRAWAEPSFCLPRNLGSGLCSALMDLFFIFSSCWCCLKKGSVLLPLTVFLKAREPEPVSHMGRLGLGLTLPEPRLVEPRVARADKPNWHLCLINYKACWTIHDMKLSKHF